MKRSYLNVFAICFSLALVLGWGIGVYGFKPTQIQDRSSEEVKTPEQTRLFFIIIDQFKENAQLQSIWLVTYAPHLPLHLGLFYPYDTIASSKDQILEESFSLTLEDGNFIPAAGFTEILKEKIGDKEYTLDYIMIDRQGLAILLSPPTIIDVIPGYSIIREQWLAAFLDKEKPVNPNHDIVGLVCRQAINVLSKSDQSPDLDLAGHILSSQPIEETAEFWLNGIKEMKNPQCAIDYTISVNQTKQHQTGAP